MLTQEQKNKVTEIYEKTMKKLGELRAKQKDIISKTLKKLEEKRIEKIRNKLKQ